MTADGSTDQRQPLEWGELHAKTLAAAEAKLAQAISASRGVELPAPSAAWKPSTTELSVVVGTPRGVFWKESHFYLVDDALDPNRVENRHRVEYRAYHSRNGLLRLTIPPEAQEALADAVRVRAFRVERSDVAFAQQWRDAIAGMDRGPRALDLWSGRAAPLTPWSPGHLPSDRALNPGQQRALAAMTAPGGFFVWGPPGTGKTTVITSAVHRALALGQSVLVTSHTNVAVDNVLKSLVEDDTAYGLGMVEPGRVIRHSPKDLDRVLGSVRDHEFLLLEKAAAVLTRHDERLKEIDEQLRSNSEHADRGREQDVHDELIRLEVDIEAVRRARRTEPLRDELAATLARLGEFEESCERLEQEIAKRASEAAAFAGLDDEIAAARAEYEGLLEARSRWAAQRESSAGELTRLAHEIDAARARQQAAELRLESAAARLLPWVGRRHRLASLEAGGAVSEMLAQDQQAREALRRADTALQSIADDLREREPRRAFLEQQAQRRDELLTEAEKLRARRRSEQERIRTLRERGAELRSTVEADGWSDDAYRELRESGHWDLVGMFDALLDRVTELDEERKELENRKKRLADEFEQKKQDLLATAPVIATTLTSLSFNPALLQRRFDVVIIDEAASAEAAAVVYAAAKADTTLAIVGDFLQNAPIAEAEADDGEDEDQLELVRWRTHDVFALAGITDRASAERHPRCVAISRQYRYPPIIADTVNEFCYDGLLESHQGEDESGDPVITFLDTSALAGREFSRVSGSWRCERTAEAAVALAAGIGAGSGGSGSIGAGSGGSGSVGYVTPYAPQATAVQRGLRARGLGFEAGTSHRFQGREFDTVIFDLMQDNRPRWVAAADLRGPKRAVSAAKLLNVAMTRAKRKLYLIGDWRFVRGHETPGMQALAALEGRANFEVRDLGDYLRGV
ncbi:AAA domain-containing protein [Leucobacter tenebrionis]|uniref:AAA domain-containing protein n=1 Tax=Leucobacter tenebrionis TaxID=2873270 RepID=UPI001CA6F94A|nr:AAA domain-containing protein [Leucobacter tenebrionis]QZY51354.1 AAA family ATPase [Leucobacter tenebrionis]